MRRLQVVCLKPKCCPSYITSCRYAWDRAPRRRAALADMSPDLEGCVLDFEGVVLGVGEVLSAGTSSDASGLSGLMSCGPIGPLLAMPRAVAEVRPQLGQLAMGSSMVLKPCVSQGLMAQ